MPGPAASFGAQSPHVRGPGRANAGLRRVLQGPASPPAAVGAAIRAVEAHAVVKTSPCGAGEMVWRVFGEPGAPPLMLMHGGYGSWWHWFRNVRSLARDRRVYVCDTPGLGESAPPPDRRDMDSIGCIVADGLRCVLEERDQRVDLVGFSFGGIVGGHAAPYLQDVLRSFTMVGVGAMGLRRARGPALERFRRDMTPAQLRSLARRNLEILMLADPRAVDDFAIHMQVVNTMRAVTKSRWVSATPVLRDRLPQSRAPLGAIWGEWDWTAWPYFRERIAAIRSIQPEARIAFVPRAGHWAMYEQPDAFEHALRSVLPDRH